MRIATDGYIDLTDARYVRTPGAYADRAEPVEEGEALAFLLTHSFPGHRRVVRPLSVDDRRRIRLALWADSVSERMALVDRVWRGITAPVTGPVSSTHAQLIQIITYRGRRWPLYLEGGRTRVIPDAPGAPPATLPREMLLDFDLRTA